MTPAPSRSNPRAGGRGVLWDPNFPAVDDARFDALRAALVALGTHATFPTPEAIDEALAPLAGVRFVRQEKTPRRRRTPRDPASMYDARIVNEGVVPTRDGSWHDLMNALVWATFPRAKRAIHARQHALVVVAKPGESLRRPRALDALALLDEGGVAVRGNGRTTTFGHAIYEGFVLGWPAPVTAAFDAGGEDVDAAIAELAARIADPRELRRLGA